MRSLCFVLLILAAKHPPPSALNAKEEEQETPKAAAPTAEAGPCGDADRALAIALNYAFEPAPDEIRVLSVEDLGLLGDPRALEPLATLVLDQNVEVEKAAVRAIGQFTAPRATQILENVVRHPRIPESVKEIAIAELPFQRRERAKSFLALVSKSGSYSSMLRTAAKGALELFDAKDTKAASPPPLPPGATQ